MGYAGEFHYEEVSLADMIVADEKDRLLFPCPCGDLFEISLDDFSKGGDVAQCPTCSLTIKVIFTVEEKEAFLLKLKNS